MTWRLQYLKDVVLARILDDPTFGVLNSMIFFNQVDIVNHLQSNSQYMKDLFGIVDNKDTNTSKRKDAITFIQQCCQIAKNLQPPARATLYNNFISNGLVPVITTALGSPDAGTRHAGVDILVAMIDHDAGLVRQHIQQAFKEKRISLIDALIKLLLTEEDLGAKAQAADAMKVLLDPQSQQQELARQNQDFMAKFRMQNGAGAPVESFIQEFYDHSAKTLFQPLKDLDGEDVGRTLNFHEGALFQYLIEILIFFTRQHQFRSKFYIAGESISAQIGKLLRCSSKHVKLTAVKYFRTCLGLQDEFYFQQVTNNHIFGPILDIVIENGSRDNLLNSACLEIFEFVRREGIKPVIEHVVQNYRETLESITFVDIFQDLVRRYDYLQENAQNANVSIFPSEEEGQMRNVNGHSRWSGLREADETEEAYFNTSDDEDELAGPGLSQKDEKLTNGTGSPMKPLVDYPDDEDDDGTATMPASPRDALNDSFYGGAPDGEVDNMVRSPARSPEFPDEDSVSAVSESGSQPAVANPSVSSAKPPETLASKRRREEDEDDELIKLSTPKRRSSTSSVSSMGSATSERVNGVFSLAHGEGRKDGKSAGQRRNRSLNNSDAGKSRKISISFTSKNAAKTEDSDADADGKKDDDGEGDGEKDDQKPVEEVDEVT